MVIIVDTVEDKIQNGVFTAIDNIINPGTQLATRKRNASYRRVVARVV